MLGPNGPYLFVGREFTAVSGSLGAGNRFALFGGKHDRPGKIGACKLYHDARDIILIGRRRTASTASSRSFVMAAS